MARRLATTQTVNWSRLNRVLPAEREFFRLLAELASDGLFVGLDGVAERIADAFEAAVAEAKSATGNLEQPEHPQQHGHSSTYPERARDPVWTKRTP